MPNGLMFRLSLFGILMCEVVFILNKSPAMMFHMAFREC